MRNPCQSLPAISLVLLLGATLPQEAQSFNAIINSNPVTIWLYNYFRSNDCFGLPFCDILAAVEDETNATDVIDDAGVAGEFDLPDIVLYEGDDDDDANTDNNDNGNSIGSLGEFTLSDLFGGLNNEDGDQNEQGEMQQVPLGDGPPGATQNEEDVNEQQLLQQVPLGDGPPGENQNVNGGSPPQVIQMPEFSETEEEGEESSSGGLVSTGIAAIENVINEGIDLIGRINFFGGRDNKGRQRRRHLRHLH